MPGFVWTQLHGLQPNWDVMASSVLLTLEATQDLISVQCTKTLQIAKEGLL